MKCNGMEITSTDLLASLADWIVKAHAESARAKNPLVQNEYREAARAIRKAKNNIRWMVQQEANDQAHFSEVSDSERRIK